jgi:hypothetical protein
MQAATVAIERNNNVRQGTLTQQLIQIFKLPTANPEALTRDS